VKLDIVIMHKCVLKYIRFADANSEFFYAPNDMASPSDYHLCNSRCENNNTS